MCVCLTKDGDVNAGRGSLVLDTLMDMADVVSAVSHCNVREDEAGAHVHGGQDVCERLRINDLAEGGERHFVITLNIKHLDSET